MPRQANGQYQQPANTAAVSGQTISSTAYNSLITDIGTELTNSLDRGGRSAMTAPLPMGAQKITGMADPTVSTDGATKNYVDTTTASFFSTGDFKFTFKGFADTGWILCDDGTFGSASSGSSNRANADTQNLFTLFFNVMSDSAAPLLTSGGGATTRAAQVSASAAWAANCRMTLPRMLGRAIGVAGSGSGLTSRSLGAWIGVETITLATTNLPAYTPSGSVTGTLSGATAAANFFSVNTGGSANVFSPSTGTATTLPVSGNIAATFTGNAQGGTSTPFSIIQPVTFLNAMVKL
ncbi:hypothetical protein [Bradyrhizobium sp. USDA 4452]